MNGLGLLALVVAVSIAIAVLLAGSDATEERTEEVVRHAD